MTCVVCRYDPLQDRWTGQPKLNRPRFALSAASAHGALYAVGGFNGEFYMSSVEVYDPKLAGTVPTSPFFPPPPPLLTLLVSPPFVSPLLVPPLHISPLSVSPPLV